MVSIDPLSFLLLTSVLLNYSSKGGVNGKREEVQFIGVMRVNANTSRSHIAVHTDVNFST